MMVRSEGRPWLRRILLAIGTLAGFSAIGFGAAALKQELDDLRIEVGAARSSLEKLGIEIGTTKLAVQKLSTDATNLNLTISSHRAALAEARQHQQAIKGEVKALTDEVTKSLQTVEDRLKRLGSATAFYRVALDDLAKNDDTLNRNIKKLAEGHEQSLTGILQRTVRLQQKLAPLARAVRMGEPGKEYIKFEPCPKESPNNC